MALLLSLLSGIFMGIPFFVPYTWPLALVGMVPLLTVLREQSPWKSLLYGYFFSLTLCAIALYPVFWTPLPLDWMGVSSYQQYFYAFTAWFLSAMVFAAPLGLWSLFASTNGGHRVRDLVTLPAGWILAEFFGALIYSLCNYAPQVMLGAHFSLSFLGTVIADDFALRQLAWFGGTYALSAFVIFVNVLIFYVWKHSSRIHVLIAFAIVIAWALVWSFSFFLPESESKIRVAALTLHVPPALNVPDETYYGYVATGRKQYEDAATANADIVIFPEGFGFTVPRDGDGMPFGIARADGMAPSIIISQKEQRGERMLSRMEYYDFSKRSVSYTYKSLLLPVGEFLTGFLRFIGTVLGVSDVMEYIGTERNYISGQRVTPQVLNDVRIGALFCNEVMSPELFRALARDGAEFFANASSQDWFRESRVVNLQLVRAARIRATESHRAYIQASNTSPSFALDAFGRTVGETRWGEETLLVVNVDRSSVRTPYSLFGSHILIIPFLIVTFALVYRRPRT